MRGDAEVTDGQGFGGFDYEFAGGRVIAGGVAFGKRDAGGKWAGAGGVEGEFRGGDGEVDGGRAEPATGVDAGAGDVGGLRVHGVAGLSGGSGGSDFIDGVDGIDL